MASFEIHNDQENSFFPARAKENLKENQKRLVLGVRNRNIENIPDGANFVQKDIPIKRGLTVRQSEANIGPLANQLAPKLKTKTFVDIKIDNVKKDFTVFCESGAVQEEKTKPTQVTAKQENRCRVLKDKAVDSLPSTADFEFSPCVATLHRAPIISSTATSSSSAEELMSEGDYAADSPMCLDTSRDSCVKSQLVPASSQLTLNERLYACHEYSTEIMLYLRSLQLEHRPRKNYMLKQTDITYAMRAILVDWLVEVVEEYHMKTETLYLAVSYIDRFLSYMSVVRTKLQLVGAAAMFIASKFEEIYPPDVKDFVFITDDTYTKKQVLRMEHLILKVLSFDLSTPTALCFLSNYTTNYSTPDVVINLAMYLLELTLMEADPYLAFLPSEMAAAALCVARHNLLTEEEAFPEKLQQVVDHHIEDLMPCIKALDKTFRCAETCPQKAIQDKYKADKYGRVSTIEPLNEDCSTVLAHYYNIKPQSNR